MTRLKGNIFRDANLVGLGGPYCVKTTTAGRIESITKELPHDPSYEDVDCRRPSGSLWLSPGMVDWHTHQDLNAVAAHRFDLKSAKSAADVFDKVRRALQLPTYDPKYGINFVGVNMRNGDWPDGDRMNRTELDKISSTRPIFLIYNGYHSLVGNTMGLERYHVDLTKFPSGVLAEQDAFAISHRLSDISDETIDLWVEEQAQHAASLGVTEIVDLEMTFNIPSWQRRCAKGFDLLKVHIGFYEEHIDDAISRGLKTGDVVPGTNGLVFAGPYKIITDGSLGSQTAFCHDVYPGTKNHGVLSYNPPKLVDMIRKGTRHGYRMAVHAIGDEANDLTLEAIRQCAPIIPESTIEHAQLLNFDSLPLFKSLGLVASIQPQHLVDDRQLCHRFWPGREPRAYAFKSIVDAGIPIKLGSDAPIAPLQPWEAMAVAMTRSSPEDLSPFCPEQRIDLKTAYTASTCNGKLHLEQGMSADLCILPRDPLECNARELRSMKVLGTMLRGHWTWRNDSLL